MHEKLSSFACRAAYIANGIPRLRKYAYILIEYPESDMYKKSSCFTCRVLSIANGTLNLICIESQADLSVDNTISI